MSVWDGYDRETYAFLPAFQERVLALWVQDQTWLRRLRSAADHRYFEDMILRDVAKLILHHFDVYRAPPDLVELVELVDEHMGFNSKKQEARDEFTRVLGALFTPLSGSPGLIQDKVTRFARHQALKAATLQQVDLLQRMAESGDPDKVAEEISAAMREALLVGVDDGGGGVRYKDAYKASLHTSYEALRAPVPTGLSTLDRAIGGGLGRGEMGIVGGGTGVGKTLVLTDWAAGSMLAGRAVYFASLEIPEARMLERLNRRLSGRSRVEIEADTDSVEARLDELTSLSKGDLQIRYFRPYVTPLSAIADDVRAVEEARGRTFDVVYVDYLDRAKPPRQRSKPHEELHELADEFAGWLKEEPAHAGWTGSQILEGASHKADNISHNQAYGGRAKVHPADVVLTLNQDEKEAKATPLPKMRVYLSKVRDFEKNKTLPCVVDYARGRLRPDEIPPG